jgi:S1-C subfamily serine protease
MKRLLITLFLFSSVMAGSCANIFGLSLVDKVKLSIVKTQFQIDAEQAYSCTGFVVNSAKGWVLTAKHCIPPDERPIYVDEKVSVVLKQSDSMAIVQIPAMSKPSLDLRTKPLQVGDRIRTFGYGRGEFLVLTRNVAAFSPNGDDMAFDGPLIEGMSGGPVVDDDGKVVGINQGVWIDKVGIACYLDEIKKFLKEK